MRGITLALMATLAMTSFALGQVTSLDYVADDFYVADGYKSFIVQATGTNINVLDEFTITGDVYQVWVDSSTQSEWLGNSSAQGATDTYVMYGDLRLPDLGLYAAGPNPSVTTETITGGGSAGVGTLNNNTGTPDAYLDTTDPTDTEATVDLLHVVIPDGQHINVDVSLQYAIYNSDTGFYDQSAPYTGSVQVNCPLDGDADVNGIVNLLDLDAMGTNYNGAGPYDWSQGDFTGDQLVNLLDLDALGTNYNQAADWYVAEGAAAPVPEPGTIVLWSLVVSAWLAIACASRKKCLCNFDRLLGSE